MSYPTLAVIGTAGRKEDQAQLTKLHYDRMVRATLSLIDHLQLDRKTLRLVSGGAAWADHLVVSLALQGEVNSQHVSLFLPCTLTPSGYTGNNEREMKTASTANYYHSLFSQKIGRDSIQEILALDHQGGTLVPGNGSFHARNAQVAKSVTPDGFLLAYTFGEPYSTQQPWTIREFGPDTKADEAGLKDGGTAHTFGLAKGRKFHGLLGGLNDTILNI